MADTAMRYQDKLEAAWRRTGSSVCVGLDPDPARLPAAFRGRKGGLVEFLVAIIDATAEHACAFKPQVAHFAAHAAEEELAAVLEHLRRHHPHHVVVLDAKRGDIGSTAIHYAAEAFDRYGADCVTVNPYLGGDTLAPFLGRPERGAFVLCRTSNPGSGDFQDLVADGEPLYLHVARRAATAWNAHGNVGLVVGATWPEELARVRAAAPTLPFLVPGVGAQGGDPVTVAKLGSRADGWGLLVNSSRAILYASSGTDFAAAAAREARKLKDDLARGAAERA